MFAQTQTGWYLVFTKPHHENIAEIHLKRQGFASYLPLMQQRKKTRKRNLYQVITEPLFPRYVFTYLKAGIDDWSKIRSTRGCVSLVHFGMLPARVPEKLVIDLRAAETDRHLPENAKTPLLKPGEKLEVIEGLLEGYEGILEMQTSDQRVILLLKVAEGHTKKVSLPLTHVKCSGEK